MQHVDDASSTLTEEVWQEVVQQRPAAPEVPLRPESRVCSLFQRTCRLHGTPAAQVLEPLPG